jgi:hypothetical protein
MFEKIFFSRTSRPKSIKPSTNPWVKGIQVGSNKGRGPLQRGDNSKNIKMGWGHLKIFFSRTIATNFNQTWHKSSLEGEGIQMSLKEGDSSSSRGDNSERVKIHRQF